MSLNINDPMQWYTQTGTDAEGKPLYSLKNPVTERIAFMTMFVSMRAITEKSAEEFWVRVDYVQRLRGAFWRNPDGTDSLLTPKDVYDHIGLSTNADDKTMAQFRKHVADNAALDAKEEWRDYRDAQQPS